MQKSVPVAEFLSKAMEISGKSQREIAREVGYENANILSMMKKGIAKVPIGRVPAFANALGVDPARLLSVVMQEYQPDVWQAISEIKGEMLSEAERRIIERFREDTADRASVDVSDEDLDEMSLIFKRL